MFTAGQCRLVPAALTPRRRDRTILDPAAPERCRRNISVKGISRHNRNTPLMSRKYRIAAVGLLTLAAAVSAALWAAYVATRHVRPFYQQALLLEPEVLQRGSRELESRATALYTDARQVGLWQALFTDDQINGWLAVQLAHELGDGNAAGIHEGVREPRIAISPGSVTLGFKTTQGGVETVVTADASAFLTDEGDVAIRLQKVRAGALPLPVMRVADELAAACHDLELPILWTQQDGAPVAMLKVGSAGAIDGRQWHIDSIELNEGELFVAGHTEIVTRDPDTAAVELDDFELRLSPSNDESMLEIARRPGKRGAERSRRPNH
jgi:hypothetical protein